MKTKIYNKLVRSLTKRLSRINKKIDLINKEKYDVETKINKLKELYKEGEYEYK